MTGKLKLYIGLLVLGMILVGGGVWLLFHPMVNTPEISENTSYAYLIPDSPPVRTWRTGQLREEELDSLLDFIKESGFAEMADNYHFPGEPIESGGLSGFRSGDMFYTVAVNYRDLHKKVGASSYLTPDEGMTYPDMPYPMNELHKVLWQIAEYRTAAVAWEYTESPLTWQ